MPTADDRLDAKRFNELLKLFASSTVNSAVGVVVGAFIVPRIASGTAGSLPAYWLIGAGIAYQCGLLITQLLVSEE